jgi:DNA segregation ATPase FtsK/SpoIIIE, S-DNA-T family
VTAAVLALVLVLAGWWVWRRESFTRQVTWRVRGWWRGRRTYRFCWQPAMVTTGLVVVVDGQEYLPKILGVRSTAAVDRVLVRMLPGQVIEDWTTAGPRLAQTFGVVECRVRSVPAHRQRVELWFLITDPLTTPVDPFTSRVIGESPDLAALPVGTREDGLVYRLRLLGTHLLVVGATGSGKSSVVWSLLAALGPGISDGLVRVWCLDPKGGMELAPGRGLFARFVYGDPDDPRVQYETEFATVLEDAVSVMRHRQSALRGRTRLHAPTVGEPLIVVVVDELASLTAYVTDRDAKRRIAAALSLLLSQGRAVGVTVVGAVQDPARKCSRSATCSLRGSPCGCPNPSTSPSLWGRVPGIAVPGVTRSPNLCPGSGTSARMGSRSRCGSGSATSPTRTSPSSSPTTRPGPVRSGNSAPRSPPA